MAVGNAPNDWPFEREGYSQAPEPAYSAAPTLEEDPPRNSTRLEAFLGSVIAGAGAVWVAQVVSVGGLQPNALAAHYHPLELTGVGLVLWLHAQYRRSTQLR